MSDPGFPLDKARAWLNRRGQGRSAFYASVDLRRGAGRVCPIDVNLFPAGFNNLCPSDAQICPEQFREAFRKRGVNLGGRIGVIAESHTRNPYYAEHLHALVGMIRTAGFQAEISCPECAQDMTVRSRSGETLTLKSIIRLDQKIIFGDEFVPDFLLVNNDFATGVPPAFDLPIQPLEPSPHLGWAFRRKHTFFEHYAKLAAEFAAEVRMDPRRIVPKSLYVPDVDFREKKGLDRIAAAVETVLAESRRWLAERGKDEESVAVIKSDYGTYGMAVMSVRSGEEVLTMNRKTVNKMHIGKGKVQTREVLVQEGIPTDDRVEDCPAEPVVYFLDGRPTGAFYRHHCERENTYNLNVSGMAFKPICLTDETARADTNLQELLAIAELAVIAAAMEISV